MNIIQKSCISRLVHRRFFEFTVVITQDCEDRGIEGGEVIFQPSKFLDQVIIDKIVDVRPFPSGRRKKVASHEYCIRSFLLDRLEQLPVPVLISMEIGNEKTVCHLIACPPGRAVVLIN